jgi:hypothetical protein
MAIEKRTKFLLGVGVVAVAVAGTVAFWPPSFLQEQASGAIGAVQKHHQVQITPKDVILGDESLRRQENVLYGDFLADASKLKNISVELRSAAAASRDASTASRSNPNALNHVSQAILDQKGHVQARYEDAANDLVASLTLAVRNANNISAQDRQHLESELNGLSAAMKSRSANRADAAEMSHRVQNVADLVQSNLQQQSIPDMQARVASARAEFQAKADNALFLKATSAFQLAAKELKDHETLGVSLRARQEYAASMVAEMNHLEDAETALASNLASRGDAQYASALNEVENNLANEALALEASAARNLDMRLHEQVEMAAVLRDLDAALESARQIASRTPALQASLLADSDQSLGTVAKQVLSQREDFQARCASSMQAEFANLGSYLQDEAQLQARVESEELAASRMDSTKLQARVDNKAQTAARAHNQDLAQSRAGSMQLGVRLFSSDSLAGLQNHVKAAASALGTRGELGIRMANRDQVEMQARELQARIDNMVASRVASREQK